MIEGSDVCIALQQPIKPVYIRQFLLIEMEWE